MTFHGLCEHLNLITKNDLACYTELELLYLMIERVNEVIKSVNTLNSNIDESIKNQLIEMKQNGELEQLINEALFTALDHKIDLMGNVPVDDDLQLLLDTVDVANFPAKTYIITKPLIVRRGKSIKGNHCKIVADFANWQGTDYTAIKFVIDETAQNTDVIFNTLNRIISDIEIVGANNENIQSNGVIIKSTVNIEDSVAVNYSYSGEFNHITIRNFDTGLVLNECWGSNFNSCKIFNVRQGIKIKGKCVNNNFNGCQVTNPSKMHTSSSDKTIGISVSNGTHYTNGKGRPEGLTFNQCLVFGYNYNAKMEHCYFVTFNSCILDGATYNNVLLRATQNIFFNQCYLCQMSGDEANITYYYDNSLGNYVNRVNIVNCDFQGINNPNAIEFKTDCPTELVIFNIDGNSFNGFKHCIRANCIAPCCSNVANNVAYNLSSSFINVIAGFGKTKIDNNNIYSSVDIINLPMAFPSDMIIGKNFSRTDRTYYQGQVTLSQGQTQVDLPNNIFNSEKGLFCQTTITPATPIGQYWVTDNILWSQAKLTVANAPSQDTTIYYTVRVFTKKSN